MIDFLMIATRTSKRGPVEIYPKFIIKKSSDLMIRGGDFYAIWIEERGMWSTDEQDAIAIIDRELDEAEASKEIEIVCRYPQFFATTKLFRYIVNKIKSSKNDGKGGTYFGATGCGKTFTMLFLSRHLQLRAKTSLGSPTIIIIVDREELQNQAMTLFQNSEEFLSCGNVKMIKSRAELKDELKYRASGGVLICTIQKFCEEIGLLSERNNIINH